LDDDEFHIYLNVAHPMDACRQIRDTHTQRERERDLKKENQKSRQLIAS